MSDTNETSAEAMKAAIGNAGGYYDYPSCIERDDDGVPHCRNDLITLDGTYSLQQLREIIKAMELTMQNDENRTSCVHYGFDGVPNDQLISPEKMAELESALSKSPIGKAVRASQEVSAVPAGWLSLTEVPESNVAIRLLFNDGSECDGEYWAPPPIEIDPEQEAGGFGYDGTDDLIVGRSRVIVAWRLL